MSIDAGKELYEIGVHFVASLAETQAQEEYKALQDNLAKKSEVVSQSDLEKIDLAYTMVTTINRKNERFNSAYFGVITFISTPDQITEIDSALAGNENVLRHIIIKTVPEAQEALERCKELFQEEKKDDEDGDDEDEENESSESEESSKEETEESSKKESDDIDQKIDEIVS